MSCRTKSVDIHKSEANERKRKMKCPS